MATAAEINEIIKLYVGYYNRAPDALGLNFWISAFDGGFSLADMAVDFSGQAETLANYEFFDASKRPPNTDPTLAQLGEFIDSVYQNLFNRSPDQEGKDFWSGKINSGEFTVGQAISLIIEGATTAPDSSVVANKVAAGLDFYTKLNAAEGGPEYVFTPADVDAATAIQAGVTDNVASLATAAGASDDFIADFSGTTSPEPGTGVTINLTDATDQPGGGGNGVDTQGTADNDTFSATVEANGGGTLQSSDNVAGGAGEDTLNIRVISATNGGQTVSPAGSDLENVVVTNQTASGNFTLDFAGITGETTVTAKDNENSALTGFNNLDAGTLIRLENVDGSVGVNIKGDRSASNNDSIDLFIQDSGTADSSAFFFAADNDLTSFDTDFEIANIETGGSSTSFLNLLGMELESLVVTGSEQLNVEDTSSNFENLKSVDASAMTGGGINVNAENNTESAFAFIGSGFDDSLELNNSLFNTANSLSLDAGDGMDTLIIGNFASISAASVNAANGFEVLQSTNATSSLNADQFTKIDIFKFDGQTGNDNRINITGVTTDDSFIFSSDVGQGDEAVRFSADTAGQSLTFELNAQSEAGGEIRMVTDTDTNNSNAAVGFGNGNINSVQIVSSGSNEDANVIRSVDTGSGNYFAFENDNGPSVFSVSGSQALTITAEEGVALTSSSDERGFSNGVSFDGSDASGNLRIAASASADALQGGSGDDILYGLGGNDVLTGNDGADQFRLSNFSGTDTIKDFTSGQDKIGLQRVDFSDTTASSAGTALSASDYVENIQNVSGMSNSEDSTLVELQLAASQSQIETSLADTFDAYLLVFNSTSNEAELWFDDDWNSTSGREHSATIEGITSLADLVGLSRTDFVEYSF